VLGLSVEKDERRSDCCECAANYSVHFSVRIECGKRDVVTENLLPTIL
jgi:hypothetical protein